MHFATLRELLRFIETMLSATRDETPRPDTGSHN